MSETVHKVIGALWNPLSDSYPEVSVYEHGELRIRFNKIWYISSAIRNHVDAMASMSGMRTALANADLMKDQSVFHATVRKFAGYPIKLPSGQPGERYAIAGCQDPRPNASIVFQGTSERFNKSWRAGSVILPIMVAAAAIYDAHLLPPLYSREELSAYLRPPTPPSLTPTDHDVVAPISGVFEAQGW